MTWDCELLKLPNAYIKRRTSPNNVPPQAVSSANFPESNTQQGRPLPPAPHPFEPQLTDVPPVQSASQHFLPSGPKTEAAPQKTGPPNPQFSTLLHPAAFTNSP
uniref:Uncharacterized protein n=1 Tax=Mesocestoides corti TaxID=53468 RepID=A0A5K3G172_MESCO